MRVAKPMHGGGEYDGNIDVYWTDGLTIVLVMTDQERSGRLCYPEGIDQSSHELRRKQIKFCGCTRVSLITAALLRLAM
jgi:hypothetical protein